MKRMWDITEAKLAGNPDYDVNADWVDYAAAGVSSPQELFGAIRHVLDAVILSRDILDLGLRSTAEPARHQQLVERIDELRHALRERLEKDGLTELVVPFEPGAYNREATVRENLLFGAATGPELADKGLAANPYFASVLKELGLDEILYGMGLEIAEQAIELFSDLPPDHPFFQQLAFMTPEELPVYEQLLQKLKGRPFDSVSEEDRVPMITLSFAYVEPRHRFGLLTEDLMEKVVAARARFYEGLPDELKNAIEPYDPERYTAAASVMDNVLFGRIAHNQPEGPDRIRAHRQRSPRRARLV